VDQSLKAPHPKAQADLGPDAAIDCQVDPTSPCLPPISFSALRRHYLRQEPYEVIPHVRIWAGGAG